MFWISVKFLTPTSAPLLRFQTRIYHLNTRHTGKSFANYESRRSDPGRGKLVGMLARVLGGAWFSERSLSQNGHRSSSLSVQTSRHHLWVVLLHPSPDSISIPVILNISRLLCACTCSNLQRERGGSLAWRMGIREHLSGVQLSKFKRYVHMLCDIELAMSLSSARWNPSFGESPYRIGRFAPNIESLSSTG